MVTGGSVGGVLGQIRLYIEVSLFLQGTSLLTDTLYISKNWEKMPAIKLSVVDWAIQRNHLGRIQICFSIHSWIVGVAWWKFPRNGCPLTPMAALW